MAQKIAEKGVTTNKGQAPKKPKGSPEMTIGEVESAAKEKFDAEAKTEESTEASSLDVSTKSDDSPTGADLVEVLSNVDGSPDEDTEGDAEPESKKKKKRRNK